MNSSFKDPPPYAEKSPSWGEIESTIVRKTVDRREEIKAKMIFAEGKYMEYATNIMQQEIWHESNAAANEGRDTIDVGFCGLGFYSWLQKTFADWSTLEDNSHMISKMVKKTETEFHAKLLRTLRQMLPNWHITTQNGSNRAQLFALSWSAQAAKLYKVEHSKASPRRQVAQPEWSYASDEY